MGQNIGICRGNRRVEPFPAEELHQHINELEGKLRQRIRREEDLQQRINELEGQLRERNRREEELQQHINERLRQRESQMTAMNLREVHGELPGEDFIPSRLL